MTTSLFAILIIVIACVIGSFGAVFLKKASDKITLNINTIISNKYLILGISFYVLATLLFIPALRYGELSVLYPFVATTYIWTSLLSVKYLNERMNRFKWLGIMLILIGVSFIGIGS